MQRLVHRLSVCASRAVVAAPTRLACSSSTSTSLLSSSSTSSSVRLFSTPAKKVDMNLIKQLRERSGAPITECKDALSSVLSAGQTDGSDSAVMDAAVEWLRKKGINTAAKKSGRVASEGLVAMQIGANSASIVEINSETDFAARNVLFKQLCVNVSGSAGSLVASKRGVAGEVPLSELTATPCVDPTAATSSVPVSTAITNVVSSLRENVQVRRVAGVTVGQGVVGTYVHNGVTVDDASATNTKLGRQAAIVGLEYDANINEEQKQTLQTIANKLAMQVVASTPKYVTRSEVPDSVISSERAVLTEQANAPPVHVPGQAKPNKPQKPKDPKQIERMVEGRINKWLGEVVLSDQQLVVSGDWDSSKPPTVSSLLSSVGATMQTNITLAGMARFLVGEGVQAKDADAFAKEVAEKLAKAK